MYLLKCLKLSFSKLKAQLLNKIIKYRVTLMLLSSLLIMFHFRIEVASFLSGRNLSEQELKLNLELISTKYGTSKKRVEIVYDHINIKKVDIFIEVHDKVTTTNTDPIEVKTLIECMFLLKKKELPFEVNNVSVEYNDTDTFGIALPTIFPTTVTTSPKEFEDLLLSVEGRPLNHEKIRILSEMWIDRNDYYRYKLQLDLNHKYRAYLLSPNNTNVKSFYDSKITLRYVDYLYDETPYISIEVPIADGTVSSTHIEMPCLKFAAFDSRSRLCVMDTDKNIYLYKSMDTDFLKRKEDAPITNSSEWREVENFNIGELDYPFNEIVFLKQLEN